MRKWGYMLVGLIGGLIIGITSTALGSSKTSIVGKKIQGEMPVYFNGKLIDSAIVVDGKSYGPIRSITTTAGLNIIVSGKTINLTPKESSTNSTSSGNTGTQGGGEEGEKLGSQEIAEQLRQIEAQGRDLDNQIIELRLKIASNPPNKEDLVAQHDALLEQVRMLKEKKSELEALQ